MTRRTAMLLLVLVPGLMAGLVTSAAHAAASDPATSVIAPGTAFDPFTLTTYALQRPSAGTSVATAVRAAARRPIRIPFRPRLRSPFRPYGGPQAW